MRSVPLAMTWEVLWRGRWSLLAGALAANFLPLFLFPALKASGGVPPHDPAMLIMHVVLVQINMFIFGAALLAVQESPSRLYTYPVSAATIAAGRLSPTVVLVMAEAALSSAALNAAFGLTWPVWGPALALGVGFAAIQATIWLMDRSAWLPWAVAIVGVVLGLWFKSRYGPMLATPTHYWRHVTPGEVAFLLVVALATYAVGAAAIARNRRGDQPFTLGVLSWFEQFSKEVAPTNPAFRSSAHAQFWYEWRQKGWVMPTAVAFGMLLAVSIWLVSERDPTEFWQGFVAGGGLLSLAGFLGGVVLGQAGSHDKEGEMGQFLATRPLTVAAMSRAVLQTAAVSVLTAWALWATAFLAVHLLLLAFHAAPQNLGATQRGFWYWYSPLTLLGPWILATIVASALLCGRPRLFVALVIASISLWIGSILLAEHVLSQEESRQAWRLAFFALGAAFITGTAWALWEARRRRLIGWPTVGLAACVWFALAVLTLLGGTLTSVDAPTLALLMGVAALSVAPAATTPLALAWNRTR